MRKVPIMIGLFIISCVGSTPAKAHMGPPEWFVGVTPYAVGLYNFGTSEPDGVFGINAHFIFVSGGFEFVYQANSPIENLGRFYVGLTPFGEILQLQGGFPLTSHDAMSFRTRIHIPISIPDEGSTPAGVRLRILESIRFVIIAEYLFGPRNLWRLGGGLAFNLDYIIGWHGL